MASSDNELEDALGDHSFLTFGGGSTAFRANVARSMALIFGHQGGSLSSTICDTNGTSSASHITWVGTMPNLFGANSVVVHGSYSGSIAGIQSLSQQQAVSAYYGSSESPNGTAGGSVSHIADLAFSDVFQGSTIWTTPALEEGLGIYGTNEFVAVQPFTFTKSVNGGTANISNISQWQVRQLLAGGNVPMSLLTGNSGDTATVYLVGRNPDSGTRLTAELDTVFQGSEVLYQPDGSCNWSISAGYSSGSGVSGVLAGTCGPAIGYLGLSDSKNVNGGANMITYNGRLPFVGTVGQALPATPDFTPIIMGQYSYWSYEHLFEKAGLSTDGSDNVSMFRNALIQEVISDIAGTGAQTALNVSAMKVKRNTDGAPIHP